MIRHLSSILILCLLVISSVSAAVIPISSEESTDPDGLVRVVEGVKLSPLDAPSRDEALDAELDRLGSELERLRQFVYYNESVDEQKTSAEDVYTVLKAELDTKADISELEAKADKSELENVAVTLSESDENPFTRKGFLFDLSLQTTLVRKMDLVYGGTIAMGYRDRTYLYSVYGRFDYFTAPLGSSTGRLATIEMNIEAGMNFAFVISAQDWQESKLSIDVGYYMQWYERSGLQNVFFLGYNGLMLRPKLSARVNLPLLKLEIGLYYQSAVLPRYSDYDGWGFYISLL